MHTPPILTEASAWPMQAPNAKHDHWPPAKTQHHIQLPNPHRQSHQTLPNPEPQGHQRPTSICAKCVPLRQKLAQPSAAQPGMQACAGACCFDIRSTSLPLYTGAEIHACPSFSAVAQAHPAAVTSPNHPMSNHHMRSQSTTAMPSRTRKKTYHASTPPMTSTTRTTW